MCLYVLYVCLRWCLWLEDVRVCLFVIHCVKLYGMCLFCACVLMCMCVFYFRKCECVGVVCELLCGVV